MGDTFTLGGDPAAIRGSAGFWSTFSIAAGSAAADIRGMDSSEFVGDEGDTYRGKVNDDLSPHLDTTSEAWQIVSTALSHYATKLEWCQLELAKLKTQYANQQQLVSNAESAVSSAKSADTAEQGRVTAAKGELKPGETLPPSTYVSATGGAQGRLTEVKAGLDHIVSAAEKIRSEHKVAVDACCLDIDRAKDMRFESPPGFWGRLKNSVVGWVKDHAAILTKISGVLKVISAIAGVLAFIPILAPIMGPIALGTGALALGIDVTLKLATGQGSWVSIGIDAATMLLPGVGKLLKPAVMGTKAGKVVNAFGVKGVKALSTSRGGKAINALADTKVGRVFVKAPGAALNKVNQKVEQGLRKIPGMNKLPQERVLVLKYRKGWTAGQRAELDMKGAQLDRLGQRGQLLKTEPPPREPNLRERYAASQGKTKNQLPSDKQVDHIHELQLGGPDDLMNVQLLDASVNRSAGPQIMHQLKKARYGTPYDRVVTVERR